MIREILRKSAWARYIYARAYVFRYLLATNRSYAQASEDVIVERLLRRVNFFIDIGANDGMRGSNTFYFARRGARGVCFEPVLDAYRRLESLYALNRDVICRRVGISESARDARLLDFWSATRGLNVPRDVDVLSIGVEGHELSVLRSIPFDEFRFGAIIVETHMTAGVAHRDLAEVEALLSRFGYGPFVRTGVNTIYLNSQHDLSLRRRLYEQAASYE